MGVLAYLTSHYVHSYVCIHVCAGHGFNYGTVRHSSLRLHYCGLPAGTGVDVQRAARIEGRKGSFRVRITIECALDNQFGLRTRHEVVHT